MSRRKPRHRGAAARANAHLDAHLESLGLASVGAYQAWCREHGLSGALSKDWQQRRHERELRGRQQAEAVQADRLRQHLEALGLADAEAYRAWCRREGLSDALRKSAEQQRRELRLHEKHRADEALRADRRAGHRLAETIDRLAAGDVGAAEVSGGTSRLIAQAFAQEADPAARDAFRRLLHRAVQHDGFLDPKPAHPELAEAPTNTFVYGLLALARHHGAWLRAPESWQAESRSQRRRFGSLARHLLARYSIPGYLDAAWFEPDPNRACRHQRWFIHLGAGRNLRRADLPLALTSRMAHWALKAPAECTIEGALRWGQVVGMGGDPSLAQAVLATRLGEMTEDEGFWATVVRFLVDSPMLDRAQVGPLVDLIHHLRFEPQELPRPDGGVDLGPPLRPDFGMKGRTVPALLRLVEDWHRRMARERRLPADQWAPCGLEGFRHEEAGEGGGPSRVWTLRELLTSLDLRAEGRAMSHCVASYANSCRRGQTSIWSLQVAEEGQTNARHVLTIAVKNASRAITEVRGKRNALPSGRQTSGSPRRVSREDEELMREGRRLLSLWARQEGLRLSRQW